MITPEIFKANILKSGILDPDGTHHQFAGGRHGKKLDFDLIDRDSELYKQWVEIVARKVYEMQSGMGIGKVALVGVANGTNELVEDIADYFRAKPLALKTQKTSPKTVALTDESQAQMVVSNPQVVYVIEDVGTEGNGSASAATSVRLMSDAPMAVINTWQRRERLENLDAIDVPYYAVIKELITTFTEEDCIKFGHCADGWELVKHD